MGMIETGKSVTSSGAEPARAADDMSARRQSAEAKLHELKSRLREISDLEAVGSVLNWDHATYMPKGGAAARARQGALLSRLRHEKSVDPALGKLLDDLLPYAEGLPSDSDEASLIRIARRDFEKAIKIPADYVARASALGSASYDAWTRARPANDFVAMQPYLEKAIDLAHEYAGYFAPYAHVADPLIDNAEEGMTAAMIAELFARLRGQLVPILRAIADQPVPCDDCLRGFFREAEQLAFSLSVVRRLGYDVDRGRLDKTRHPFCSKFSLGDIRITTRVNENLFGCALFAAIHEAGHALYEQGVAPALEGTPLGTGTSWGVHESQSRLWENVVGRSRPFWEHFYPVLRDAFPDRLNGTDCETFYRAINKVKRSSIRTDADEVTYNLHIMLRFDLELELLEGRLRVRDLPEAWRARMKADVGIAPDDDRDGCLQDVHWYGGGAFGGGFQSYTIGNILSAQFHAAAIKAHPEIPGEIANGQFGTLHSWLCTNLYQHGRKFGPAELVSRAAGAPMSIEAYIGYLHAKYGELYRLPPAGEIDQSEVETRIHT
ncbi:MAG TPA: carboxypeptidase M32 [Methylocella sp.]|nr:carboxypeptidase M32 [Methylocella sp.]